MPFTGKEKTSKHLTKNFVYPFRLLRNASETGRIKLSE